MIVLKVNRVIWTGTVISADLGGSSNYSSEN